MSNKRYYISACKKEDDDYADVSFHSFDSIEEAFEQIKEWRINHPTLKFRLTVEMTTVFHIDIPHHLDNEQFEKYRDIIVGK